MKTSSNNKSNEYFGYYFPSVVKCKLNPGSIWSIHNTARQIMPHFISGVKINMNRNSFGNIMFDGLLPSGVCFGQIFTMPTHDKMLPAPTIYGIVNLSKNMNVKVTYVQIEETVRSRAKLRVGAHSSISYTIDFMYPYHTTTWQIGSKGLSSSFFKRIDNNWSWGAGLYWNWMKSYFFLPDIGLAARYSMEDSVLAGSISRNRIALSYWQKIGKREQIALFISSNLLRNKYVASFCYQINIENVTVRCLMTTDYCFGVTALDEGGSIHLFYRAPTNTFNVGFKFNVN